MRYNIRLDMAKNRNKFFMVSALITLFGVITLLVFGLNLGVDFRSGSSIDIEFGKTVTQDLVNQGLNDVNLTAEYVNIGGDQNNRATIRFKDNIPASDVTKLEESLTKLNGQSISSEENSVSPDLAREMVYNALLAVGVATLFIFVYIIIRFEWRFAIGGIVALLHDVFIVVSLFSIFRLEVNLPFIAAVLTIIGYSINDTIVIFDRIRENLRFAKIKTFEDLEKLVNESIWQTMTRSINTVMTVLIATLFLFFLGSVSLKLFSLAMIFGLISGAYSSIFIASQVWLLLKRNSMKAATTSVNVATAKE